MRTAYEFSTTGEDELPSTISLSKQDATDSSDAVIHYTLPNKLLEKLTGILNDIRLHGRSKRKRIDVERSHTTTTAPVAKAPVVDIIGDIFEDAGVYNAEDALRSAGVLTGSAESIFSGLRAKTTQEIDAERAAAEAEESEAQFVARTLEQGAGSDKRLPTIASAEVADESAKIHRDIFGIDENAKAVAKKQQEAGVSLVGNSYEGGIHDDCITNISCSTLKLSQRLLKKFHVIIQ